ncbi:MAG: hypothetical protein KKB50_01070 [Planctomycetes bacterium]|nr:hypothetical protein [Planctomycetota bacterium]
MATQPMWSENGTKSPESSERAKDGNPARLRGVVLTACVLGGLLIRGLLIVAAPGHGYLADHVDLMAWAEYARVHGPYRLYDLPPDTQIAVNVPPRLAGEYRVLPGQVLNVCNYPPAACYVFWLQGWLWRGVDDRRLEVRGPDGQAGSALPVVNTVAARLVNALPSVAADLLMAVGVLLLVRVSGRGQGGSGAELAAFALVVFAPPILLVSCFWNQTDAWVTCLLVWCLYSLLRQRFCLAGILYGLALMTKQQALLFAPVLVYVGLSLWLSRGGTARAAARMVRMILVAAVTIVLVAAPVSITDSNRPGGGWMRWARRCYVESLTEKFPFTTLKGFNVWWLDSLAHGHTPEGLDPKAKVLGVSKDTLGKLLLTGAILATWALCARRWRWEPDAWGACAFLVTYAAFVLLTRIHERYIYYCLPFLIAVAVRFWAWIPTLIAVLLVGTFETTWFLWYAAQEDWPGIAGHSADVRAWSGFLAVLALGALVYSLAVLWPSRGGCATCEKRQN